MPNGFQSTPPARGATTGFSRDKWLTLISIHAPREGGRPAGQIHDIHTAAQFQSTPPARGATAPSLPSMYASPISIHAPREGATTTEFITRRPFKHFNPRPPRGGRPIYPRRMDHHHYFNPRPPRGGRPYPAHSYARTWPFQSTPPARGATPVRVKCPAADAISIHAPREGGDDTRTGTTRPTVKISIHAPREGGDRACMARTGRPRKISIHAPREGGDSNGSLGSFLPHKFQSTPPARGATAKMHSFTCGSLTNK